DGETVSAAGEDGAIGVWDARTGRRRLSPRRQSEIVTGLAYSPDGSRLGTSGDDGSVCVWETRTGRKSLTLQGPREGLLSVAFSPDGSRIAAASGRTLIIKINLDGKDAAREGRSHPILIWDANTGTHLTTLNGHTGSIHGLAFSP